MSHHSRADDLTCLPEALGGIASGSTPAQFAEMSCRSHLQSALARAHIQTALACLAPAARRCTQVHHMMYPVQYGKGLIDLQELECAARPPTLFLCFAIIYVSLVLQGGHLL